MKKEALLKNTLLSKFVPYEELNLLKVKIIREDSLIYKDSDYSHVLYILKGQAILCHNQIDKYAYFPAIYGEGSILGDHLEDKRYKEYIDYYTIQETVVLYIPREVMEKWKKKYPSLVIHLYKSVSNRDYLINIYQYIRNQKGLGPSIAFIIDAYSENNVFKYKNVTQLAMRFNTTRKSMHYILKEFVEEGIIEKEKKGQLHIKNIKKLKEKFEKKLFLLD